LSNPTLMQSVPHDRIAALLGHGVSATLVARLVSAPRLQIRLAAMISAQLGEIEGLDEDQASVLAMTPEAIADLSTRAGLVWHAGSVARVIDAVSRRALVAALGENNYVLALDGIAMAAPATLAPSPKTIEDAIRVDGPACLTAWCETQPPGIASRLALLLPPASTTSAHKAAGPAIVAWVLRR
jgi:hypothetical protein